MLFPGSTETVVEASPIGKKFQSNKKRPENLDIGATASVVGLKKLVSVWFINLILFVWLQEPAAGNRAPAWLRTTWLVTAPRGSTVPLTGAWTPTPGRRRSLGLGPTEPPALPWPPPPRGNLTSVWPIQMIVMFQIDLSQSLSGLVRGISQTWLTRSKYLSNETVSLSVNSLRTFLFLV